MFILIIMFISVVLPLALFVVDDIKSKIEEKRQAPAMQARYDANFERKFGFKPN